MPFLFFCFFVIHARPPSSTTTTHSRPAGHANAHVPRFLSFDWIAGNYRTSLSSDRWVVRLAQECELIWVINWSIFWKDVVDILPSLGAHRPTAVSGSSPPRSRRKISFENHCEQPGGDCKIRNSETIHHDRSVFPIFVRHVLYMNKLK